MGWLKRSTRLTGDTARRLTGISFPLGGVTWADPGPSQREKIRAFLLALEDRRALYNPTCLEVRGDVDHSIHAIRASCTEALKALGEQDFGVVPIRAIRTACRRFHDDAQEVFPHFGGWPRDPHSDAGFFAALGMLRGTVGQQVAMLVAHYDLTVEGDLATILPLGDDDGPER